MIIQLLALTLTMTSAPGAGRPEAALEALRAANTVRSEDAQEAAAHQREAAELELLRTTLEQEAERLRSERRRRAERIATLEARRSALEPKQDGAGALRRLLIAQAERLEAALDRMARATFPGVVPEQRRAVGAVARFEAASARLDAAERNATRAGVEIATGELEGNDRSVELLRLGGVAGWWRGLDGDQVGIAKMVDGRLVLGVVTGPGAEAIRRAMTVAKGRATPQLVLLPFDHARTP